MQQRDHLDRGPALLRELRRRHPRHRPRALSQDVAEAQVASRAARRSPSSSSRTRWRRRTNRTVFQKLREAALAYHLTRKWSKDKILTEYLNSIYFGNGAYGDRVGRADVLRHQPDHLDCGTQGHRAVRHGAQRRRRRRCSPGSSPPRARYDPVAHPQAATRRRNLVLKNMLDQGQLTPGGVRQRTPGGAARRGGHQAAAVRRPEAPYFTTWVRQQLVDHFGARRAFEGGLQIRTTLDLDLQQAAQTRSTRTLPDPNGPTAVARGDRQRRPARCARWSAGATTRRGPSTSPRRASASRARRSSRSSSPRRCSSGNSAGSVWPSQQADLHRARDTGGKEKFVVNNFENNYAGAHDAGRRPDVLRQLGLRRPSASRSGPSRSRKLAERMGIRTPVSTNSAMTLGGLHAGRHAARHGPRLRDVRRARPRASAARSAPATTGPVGIRERPRRPAARCSTKNKRPTHPRAPAATWPTRPCGMHDQRVVSQRHRHARRAAAGPVRRRQDRHDRELRRRLVRRLQRAADGRGLGRLPGQAHADEDRVRAASRSTGGTFPALDLARLHDRGATTSSPTRKAKEREKKGLPPLPPEDQNAADHVEPGRDDPDQTGAGAGGRRGARSGSPRRRPAVATSQGGGGTSSGTTSTPPASTDAGAAPARRSGDAAAPRGTSGGTSARGAQRLTKGRSGRAHAAPATAATRAGCRRAEAPRQLDGLGDPDARADDDLRRLASRSGAARRGSARRSAIVPLSSRPMPSACVSLPGPEQRSSTRSTPAARAHRARGRRAARAPGSAPPRPTPSGSQTALSSAWTP